MRSCPLATMRFFQHRVTFMFSLAALFLFNILFFQLEQKVHGGTGISSIMLQFAFSSARFFEIVMSWLPEGALYWQQLLWLDMLYPIVYVTFLIALLRQAKVNVIIFYPLTIAAGFFDILENSLHLIILSGNKIALIPFAAAFAGIKWLFIAIILAAALFTPLYRYFNKARPVSYP
jgi:hypothetical protein